jgi:hypothetical protein
MQGGRARQQMVKALDLQEKTSEMVTEYFKKMTLRPMNPVSHTQDLNLPIRVPARVPCRLQLVQQARAQRAHWTCSARTKLE